MQRKIRASAKPNPPTHTITSIDHSLIQGSCAPTPEPRLLLYHTDLPPPRLSPQTPSLATARRPKAHQQPRRP